MALLTKQHLQTIDTARAAFRPRNIIFSGHLRLLLTGSQKSPLHCSNKECFVVLDDIQLRCYDDEINWRQGLPHSYCIDLDSVLDIQCLPGILDIVMFSEYSLLEERVRFTCSSPRHLGYWQELLPICLLGSRSLRSFASDVGLSLQSSVREIIDRITSAFPKSLTTQSCHAIQGKPSASAPLTRLSSFYKRIIAEQHILMQIRIIRRMLDHNCAALEKAIVEEIADKNNDESVRRDALQLLWDVCSSCPQTPSCKYPLSCNRCLIGSRKFLFHITLLSHNQIPDQAISDGLLDVLLQRTKSNPGDNHVKQPRVWPVLFSILAFVTPDHRQHLLQTINYLLIESQHNRSTLAAQTGWQHMLYSCIVADRAGIDMIVSLSLNILVIMSYDSLVNSDHFITTVSETLEELQLIGGPDLVSLQICRTFLASLSNKIAANIKSFPFQCGSRAWTQTILFSKVILALMIPATERDSSRRSLYRHRMTSKHSLSFNDIKNRLRHKRSTHSQTDFSCLRGKTSGGVDGYITLAERMSCLFDKIIEVAQDPNLRHDLSRIPNVIRDAELIKEIFRHISLRDDQASNETFRDLISSRLDGLSLNTECY